MGVPLVRGCVIFASCLAVVYHMAAGPCAHHPHAPCNLGSIHCACESPACCDAESSQCPADPANGRGDHHQSHDSGVVSGNTVVAKLKWSGLDIWQVDIALTFEAVADGLGYSSSKRSQLSHQDSYLVLGRLLV